MATELNATLRKYLTTAERGQDEQWGRRTWTFTFSVPRDSWNDSLLPEVGSESPAELGATGVILHKDADYNRTPGYVMAKLVCGLVFRYTTPPE